MNAKSAIQTYTKTKTESSIADASPTQLITSLLDGALECMTTAKGAMNRGDFAGGGESIGKAMKIIDGLDVLLDHEAGGDIASNLSRLYEYMTTLLLQANIRRDSQLISEASALLGEIREGWAALPEDVASELG